MDDAPAPRARPRRRPARAPSRRGGSSPPRAAAASKSMSDEVRAHLRDGLVGIGSPSRFSSSASQSQSRRQVSNLKRGEKMRGHLRRGVALGQRIDVARQSSSLPGSSPMLNMRDLVVAADQAHAPPGCGRLPSRRRSRACCTASRSGSRPPGLPRRSSWAALSAFVARGPAASHPDDVGNRLPHGHHLSFPAAILKSMASGTVLIGLALAILAVGAAAVDAASWSARREAAARLDRLLAETARTRGGRRSPSTGASTSCAGRRWRRVSGASRSAWSTGRRASRTTSARSGPPAPGRRREDRPAARDLAEDREARRRRHAARGPPEAARSCAGRSARRSSSRRSRQVAAARVLRDAASASATASSSTPSIFVQDRLVPDRQQVPARELPPRPRGRGRRRERQRARAALRAATSAGTSTRSRDKYIRPASGTCDFALMYVPAEAVYAEIAADGRGDGARRLRGGQARHPGLAAAPLRVPLDGRAGAARRRAAGERPGGPPEPRRPLAALGPRRRPARKARRPPGERAEAVRGDLEGVRPLRDPARNDRREGRRDRGGRSSRSPRCCRLPDAGPG